LAASTLVLDRKRWPDDFNPQLKFGENEALKCPGYNYKKGIQRTNFINFMVTSCINNIQHFNNQLTYTTLKNVALLKHCKISKTAPTCFGLQGNHHQGATIVCTQASQVTICSHNTENVLYSLYLSTFNQVCNF
jgi:hypothetical protein